MIDIALLVAIVALIFAHIRLRDRIEVLETVVDRLDRESATAAKASN
jgi:hypothetical protein